MKQLLLSNKVVKYSYGSYNKFNDYEQWIRITEGCPHNCPFCYEPTELKIFDIPKIVRNKVKIMDMNILCKPKALEIIKMLGEQRVNKKVVNYELICGIDYRFITKEIAYALKKNRFKKIRLAWDWKFKEQLKIKDALWKLFKVGYKPNHIMIFMICNWKISYKENLRKLDLCKVWNVKVADCYYDNQIKIINPIFWTEEQINSFRMKTRKHNQLVNFKMDPQIGINQFAYG